MPIVIAGPWAAPRIYPDIKGILENPAQAYEQLKELGGGLVSLPGLDQLGKKAGISGATGSVPLQGIIKDGKVNKDALRQGAIEGLGALINKQKSAKPVPPAGNAAVAPPAQPPAARPQLPPAPAPSAFRGPASRAARPPAAPNQKAKKKKQKPEDVAKQLMQELLLGNQ